MHLTQRGIVHIPEVRSSVVSNDLQKVIALPQVQNRGQTINMPGTPTNGKRFTTSAGIVHAAVSTVFIKTTPHPRKCWPIQALQTITAPLFSLSWKP